MKKTIHITALLLTLVMLLSALSACGKRNLSEYLKEAMENGTEREISIFAETPKGAVNNVVAAIQNGDIDAYYKYLGTDTFNGTKYLLLGGWLGQYDLESQQDFFEEINYETLSNMPIEFLLLSIFIDEVNYTYEELVGKPAPQICSIDDYIDYQKAVYPRYAEKVFLSVRAEFDDDGSFLKALSGEEYEDAYGEVLTYIGNIGSKEIQGKEIEEIWEVECEYLASVNKDSLDRFWNGADIIEEARELDVIEGSFGGCDHWNIVKFSEGYICIPAIFYNVY